MQKKPNFFIVGPPKSGTSAIYEMLQQHPEICMCDEKEPGFFAKDFFEESFNYHGRNLFCHSETMESYLKLFNHTNEKIIGEGSTHYLYSNVAAKNIYEFNPHSKILIMLREPIDFMHALHAQQLSETREDIKDFKKALELEESRKQHKNIPKRSRCPSYHFYRAQADYLNQIERFTKLFPKNQIKIIIFEDFKSDNLSYLKEIIKFLGVQENFVPKVMEVNKNKTVRLRFLYYFIQSPELKIFLRKRIKTATYFSIKKLIDKIFFRIERRQDIPSELLSNLRREFKPKIKELNEFLHKEQFTDIDILQLWGYGP